MVMSLVCCHPQSLLKIIYVCVHVCVPLNVLVWGVHENQKKVLGVLAMEVLVTVNCSTCVAVV